jgi:hypothetical protein
MKYIITLAIIVLFSFFGYQRYEAYCDGEPEMGHAIDFEEMVPQGSPVTINVNGKSGNFIAGYRIVTQKYVLISTIAGLNKGQGKIFDAKSLVPKGITESFSKLVMALEENLKVNGPAKNLKDVSGDLLYEKDGVTPMIFENEDGRKLNVILLAAATYDGKTYTIDRKRRDNY